MTVTNPPTDRTFSFRRGQSLLALLFFTLVSGLLLYPLFPHFFTKLPAGGDANEYLWKLWWFKHSLLETGQSPWFVPEIYYPSGYRLAYGEITATNTIVMLPFTWLLGEVATYNLLVLLSTILSGFGTFLLAREVTGHAGAGLLAGVIFAFAPFRYSEFIHLPLFPTQWLPLTFFCLERMVRTRQQRYGVAGGLFFALNALSSWYYAVMGGLFAALWALLRVRPLWASLRQRWLWQTFGSFALVALLLIAPFAYPYLTVLGSSDVTIPLQNTNFFSASLTDYFLPSPAQFLWGGWVLQNLLNRPGAGGFILGFGWVAWLFAIYGLVNGSGRSKWVWFTVMTAAMVLSFGLTLHLAGRQVVIPAPAAVTDTFNNAMNTLALDYSRQGEPFTIGSDNGLVVPLPALFIRWFVPVIAKMRVWTRFGVVALLGVSVLAALGGAAWQRRELAKLSLTRQRVAWAAVIGLALFELWWTPRPMIEPAYSRPADEWLAAQPGQFTIIEFPLDSGFDPRQMLYWRTHQKQMVHGYTTFLSFLFSQQHSEMLTFPNAAAIRQLQAWGVKYVLVETAPPHTEASAKILEQMAQESCFQQQALHDTVYIFELLDCSP